MTLSDEEYGNAGVRQQTPALRSPLGFAARWLAIGTDTDAARSAVRTEAFYRLFWLGA